MDEKSEEHDFGAFDMKNCAQSLPDTEKNPRNGVSDDEFAKAEDELYSKEITSSENEQVDEEELKKKHDGLCNEELEKLKNEAESLKGDANARYKEHNFEEAIKLYTEALNVCPLKFPKVRSVLYSNRAAAKMGLDQNEEAVTDLSKALELDPDYLRAVLRRAQLHKKLDNLEKCYEDYKKVLELDKENVEARVAVATLPAQIEEKNEKLKQEMFGKLKELGNICLKPFGLSTDNFKVVQDPNTGGYSVNFQNNS